jgi:PPOX class probable F420-dependent enzyme
MNLSDLPQAFKDLLSDESRAYAYLATIMDDGSPQLTPVWFNTDGEHILLNSTRGRVKDQNMRARPSIAVVVHDQKNPYRYIQFRGTVVEITEEGARQHIDQLSEKFTGNPEYTLNHPAEIRVTYKMLPVNIQLMG